jgi:hypothetical protein
MSLVNVPFQFEHMSKFALVTFNHIYPIFRQDLFSCLMATGLCLGCRFLTLASGKNGDNPDGTPLQSQSDSCD